MALSDFSNNYLDRTAGLRNFVAPPPPFIDSNGQPAVSPGSGSAMSALASLLPPQDVTAPAPASSTPSGMQSFSDKDPTGKAMDISNEAYQPGYIAKSDQMAAQPATPFRDSALGALAAGLIPGLSTSFARERGQALADFWSQHVGDNPTAQNIVGAMKADPIHAKEYLPTLMQEIDPAHAAEGQEAQDKLKSKRGLQALFGQEAETQAQPAAPSTQIAPAQPQAHTGSVPLGAQQNNPLNIRFNPENQWEGQTGENKGFAVFDKPESGIRAGAKILDSYAKRGINTLDGVISEWAPAKDGNNPAAYAATVSKISGIPRDGSINPADPETQKALIGAMQQVEVGKQNAQSPQAVAAGVSAANMPQTAALSQFSDYSDRLQHEQELRLKAAAIDPSLASYALAGKAVQPPQTKPGQIMADLHAGNITEEQAQQQLALASKPSYEKMGDTLYKIVPGQDPVPVASNATNKYNPQTGQFEGTGQATPLTGAPPSATFGFHLPPVNPVVAKGMIEQDKSQQLAAENNRPIAENILRSLDSLEANLDKVKTGKGAETIQGVNSLVNTLTPFGNEQAAESAANIEKGTNDLALQFSKFQPMPGSKGGNRLQLQTIINSKPGLQYPRQTSQNIMASMRATVNDAMISADIADQYRQASPMGVTDSNTRLLDDALKAIYPLEKVNKKTGVTTFSQENADEIRKLIPQAIANPKPFLEQARRMGAISYDPTKMAANSTTQASEKALTTPSGIQYTVVGQ